MEGELDIAGEWRDVACCGGGSRNEVDWEQSLPRMEVRMNSEWDMGVSPGLGHTSAPPPPLLLDIFTMNLHQCP